MIPRVTLPASDFTATREVRTTRSPSIYSYSSPRRRPWRRQLTVVFIFSQPQRSLDFSCTLKIHFVHARHDCSISYNLSSLAIKGLLNLQLKDHLPAHNQDTPLQSLLRVRKR
jgi:hypothetical protein